MVFCAAGFCIHCRPGGVAGGYGSESHQPAASAAGEGVHFMEFACALFWGTYLLEIAICGYVGAVYRVYFVPECMFAMICHLVDLAHFHFEIPS